MVVLTKIYTKTGDKGTTALGSGERVAKNHVRIIAYGTVDETNAAIGVARSLLDDTQREMDAMLARIQNDLFDLGADLATPPDATLKWEPLRIVAAQVTRLESEIDRLNAEFLQGHVKIVDILALAELERIVMQADVADPVLVAPASRVSLGDPEQRLAIAPAGMEIGRAHV